MGVFILGLVVGVVAGIYISGEISREQVPEKTVTYTIERGPYYSRPGPVLLLDTAYYETLLKTLSRANKSVYIVMYVVKYDPREPGDPVNRILEVLAGLAKRGLDIKIVVDDETNQSYPETIQFMKSRGLSVRLDESSSRTTHTKLVIVDGVIVFIGSHNWTESALTKNHEVSVLIEDEEVAREATKYFYSIWDRGRPV